MTRWFLATAAMIAVLSGPARADDGASETAAGGIITFGTERRIEMSREQLRISRLPNLLKHSAGDQPYVDKVLVDFDFINRSPDNVTTEVSFPIPPYRFRHGDVGGPRDIGTFETWVDGKAIQVTRQVRALVDGEDYSNVLRDLGVDIDRFGMCAQTRDGSSQFDELPPAQIDRLANLGLVEKDEGAPCDGVWPSWTVEILWHWTQAFPSGKTVHIRHEYTPSVGAQVCGMDLRGISAGTADPIAAAHLPTDGCFDPVLLKSLARPDYAGCRIDLWVKHILTTANTWKTPIGSFELLVDHPADQHVSFCWDSPIESVSATTVRATAKDFVPKRELTVYFF